MKILDATCAERAMWFDKHDECTTYIDIRPEMNPDLVMDCSKTNFPDKTFDMIMFDPPHLNFGPNGIFAQKYGKWSTKDILNIIKNAFVEFNRILKDEGFVCFKWNDHSIKLERVMKLPGPEWKALLGQKTAFRTKHASSTYWIIFRKAEIEKARK